MGTWGKMSHAQLIWAESMKVHQVLCLLLGSCRVMGWDSFMSKENKTDKTTSKTSLKSTLSSETSLDHINGPYPPTGDLI